MRNDTKLNVLWDEVEDLKKSGGGGGGSDLPDVTVANNGMVLGVVKGEWDKMEIPKQIIDYSTTEQNTGRKWIDGKDIYQKTLIIEEASYSTSMTITHNIGMDRVISYDGFWETNSGADVHPLPAITNSTNYACSIFTFKENTFDLSIGSSLLTSIERIVVNVFYTKVTPTNTKKKTTK